VPSPAPLLKANLINLRIRYNEGAFSGIVGNKDFLKTSNSEQRLREQAKFSTDSGIDPNDSLGHHCVHIRPKIPRWMHHQFHARRLAWLTEGHAVRYELDHCKLCQCLDPLVLTRV
jgi:hypothetical protein